MRALEEMLARWRKNPDAQLTVALCATIGSSKREELVREVGVAAETWHRKDLSVMVAVGRMYLEAGLLAEAQAALVNAGKVDPNAAEPYRYLGEVLLRRGDAARSEKVLARAIQLGRTDDDTKLWHERASVYLGLQKRVGPQAVADELSRTVPMVNSIPPPTLGANGVDDLEASTVRGAQAVIEEELPTQRKSSLPPPPAPPRAPRFGGTQLGVAPPGLGSTQLGVAPPGLGGTQLGVAPPAMAPRLNATQMGVAPQGLAPAFGSASSSAPVRTAVRVGASSGVSAQVAVPSANDALPSWDLADSTAEELDVEPEAAPIAAAPFGVPIPPAAAIPQFSPAVPPPAPVAVAPFAAPASPFAPAGAASPFQPAAFQANAASYAAAAVDPAGVPDANEVLQQLALAGIYDSQVTAPPPWEAPKARRPKGLWFLLGVVVVVLLGAVGAHRYQSMVRERELAEARALEAEVKGLLRQGTPQSLQASEDKFKRIFELDSTSQAAALLWLHNRALGALVLDQEPRGISGAIQRLEALGAPADQVATGRLGSALIEGDLAAAAGIMAKLDVTAANEPIYQLLSGVVLDRAGEPGALARYKKAIELDPELLLAHVLAGQLALLQGGPEGKLVLDNALAKLGSAPAAKALRALAWALGPRDGALPGDATLSDEEGRSLPRLLRAVPMATSALQKLAQGQGDAALEALASAIAASGSPQVSSWLGFMALEAGDAELARNAALRAMRFSAVYVGARVLAARVAVTGARLEEAKKAVEGLDPNDPQIAIVHASAAYEGLDMPTLEDTAARFDATAQPRLAALAQAPAVALGKKYPSAEAAKQLAAPNVVLGEIVALDALLDKGQLKEAEEVLGTLGKRAGLPVVNLRRSRLLRYQEKGDEAVKSVDAALREGSPTQRALIEAVYALLAVDNTASARDLLTRYSSVLGPSAEWLKALVDFASNNPRRAKATVAGLEVPPADAPLLHRVLAARTLATVGDRRAKEQIAPLLRTFSRNPDVVLAGKAVGLVR
jgi:tetratricopeptide (TPR) repeat protein